MKLEKSDRIFYGISAFLIVLTLGLGIGFPFLFSKIMRDNLVIKPGSKSYNMWIETPLPMYLDIYLFNVTNADEFAKNNSLKLVVEEVGPFIFREVHDRVNVTWNDDGTVSYNQTRNWTFVAESSVPLDTPITSFDVISLGAAHLFRFSSPLTQKILDGVIRIASKPFVTRPAEEWLFKGMDLPLLKIVDKIEKKIPFFRKIVNFPDKFGFFYQRNMSAAYDGRFDVLTGATALTDIGNMVRWNNKTQTKFFNDYCAMVNGSAGEIFPPNNENEFELFITDVCSSLTLKFDEVVNVEGLYGRQYVGDDTMFDNGDKLPERRCFCEGECVPTGARNLSRCRDGAPVFVSYPHFYLADPSYIEKVDGLSPNKSLHEFRLTLEPKTGIPLDVRAQLQVNIHLTPNPYYHFYKNVSPTFVPMLWFSQKAHITRPLASQASLLIILGLLHIVMYSLAAFFIVCVTVRLIYKYIETEREEDKELLVDNEIGQEES